MMCCCWPSPPSSSSRLRKLPPWPSIWRATWHARSPAASALSTEDGRRLEKTLVRRRQSQNDDRHAGNGLQGDALAQEHRAQQQCDDGNQERHERDIGRADIRYDPVIKDI